MSGKTGHRKLLEQLEADGIQYMFGNPGSSEEGLLDEISRFPAIGYILGLQEAAIVGIADGYAQATQRPAVVQLHCQRWCNCIAASVSAMPSAASITPSGDARLCSSSQASPLLIITGESGAAYDSMDAQMAADLVAMARPVTKYATRVIDSRSLLRLLRRCLKMAATPPFGPVFLSVPQDILDAPNDESVLQTVVPSTRVVPEPSAIAAVAALLRGAQNPLILMGDGVAHSQAQAELVQLADVLGARVYGDVLGARVYGVMASELNMPWTHPLYCGLIGHMFGHSSQRLVADADVVVICGTYVFPEVFPLLTSPFRADAKIIHIDLDPYEIAKNHPITTGLLSDPKLTLKALADAVADSATPAQREAAVGRACAIGEANQRTLVEAKSADLGGSQSAGRGRARRRTAAHVSLRGGACPAIAARHDSVR